MLLVLGGMAALLYMAKIIQKFAQVPLEISTRTMASYIQPGEIIVVLILTGVGNTSGYRFGGKTNRVFRFEWKNQRHEIRIPLSVWLADKLAVQKELFDQKLAYPIMVDIEVPAQAQAQGASNAVDTLAIATLAGEKDALLFKNAKLTQELCILKGEDVPPDVLAILNPPEETPVQAEQTPSAESTLSTPSSETEPALSLEVLRDIISGLEKKTRVKELAEEMEVDPQTIKDLAAQPDSGIEISQQGWITLIAPTPTV